MYVRGVHGNGQDRGCGLPWQDRMSAHQRQTYTGRSVCVGLARTIYIRCINGIFDREITKYTAIYGVYIQF